MFELKKRGFLGWKVVRGRAEHGHHTGLEIWFLDSTVHITAAVSCYFVLYHNTHQCFSDNDIYALLID